MVSSFSIVGSIIFLFELTHCDLRFDQVKEAMDDLGYYVAGMVCNTSNYGLPQQRQRAWLMCVLKSQSSRSATDQMCQALGLFQCEPIPLEKIISKKPPSQPQTAKPSRAKPSGAKWKRTIKEVYKQFGKAMCFGNAGVGREKTSLSVDVSSADCFLSN